MPRKLFKRILPHPERVKNHRSLRFLGHRLHDPNLWHLNRYSVATAFFIGLFVAFLPIPGQLVLAALMALWWRANLVLSVILVFVTNPVTMPPMYYFSYRVGAAILQQPMYPFRFELSWDWLSGQFAVIWQPFLLGCIVSGLFFGLLGAALVRVGWRLYVLHGWRQRRLRRGRRQS